MLTLVLAVSVAAAPPLVRVGSKAFTESVIIGELAAQAIRAEGVATEHRRELGGTAILWAALLRGDIDVYPEYTGTLRYELLAGSVPPDDAALETALRQRGLRMSSPLGFENTYALGMLEKRAATLGLARLSQLAGLELRFGLSHEFLERGDGWPGLARRYDIRAADVRGMQHELTYRAVASGSVDVIDVYTTDAQIERLGLRVLADDRHYFPEYRAVYVFRAELEERVPAAVQALRKLAGTIDTRTMRQLNARADLSREPEASVAASVLHERGVTQAAPADTLGRRLLRTTRDHLWLVGASLFLAIVIALPLGVFCARQRRFGAAVVGLCGLVQTIPALALLVAMIPLFGIGFAPAAAALFLYSLLPIVQNTYLGLTSLSQPLFESAVALGLGARARLFKVELPLALPAILAGVKTAAVINVGAATLGALIGAGGYGQPILTGIRLNDLGLVLEGAIPAALLALATQGGMGLLERGLVPRGLRLERSQRPAAARTR